LKIEKRRNNQGENKNANQNFGDQGLLHLGDPPFYQGKIRYLGKMTALRPKRCAKMMRKTVQASFILPNQTRCSNNRCPQEGHRDEHRTDWET
jgi:hypothetical protein